jgi:hypothetical protein
LHVQLHKYIDSSSLSSTPSPCSSSSASVHPLLLHVLHTTSPLIVIACAPHLHHRPCLFPFLRPLLFQSCHLPRLVTHAIP